MGEEGGRRNQQKTRSRAAPSRGRGVLSIRDNPEAVLTAIKPALPPKNNFESRFRPLIDLSYPCQPHTAASFLEGWCRTEMFHQ